jgi:hypothetical protein
MRPSEAVRPRPLSELRMERIEVEEDQAVERAERRLAAHLALEAERRRNGEDDNNGVRVRRVARRRCPQCAPSAPCLFHGFGGLAA